MAQSEIRVDTMDQSPEKYLEELGLGERMVTILTGLDVILDPEASMDEDFWGLVKSELGMAGLDYDDLPGRRHLSSGTGTVMVLEERDLPGVLEAVQSAIDHWMDRGHSPQRVLDIAFLVAKGRGMEKAEVRGPASSLRDALLIGRDGFSEVGS